MIVHEQLRVEAMKVNCGPLPSVQVTPSKSRTMVELEWRMHELAHKWWRNTTAGPKAQRGIPCSLIALMARNSATDQLLKG